MKIRWKPLLINLAIPLAVGGLSALLTREGMKKFPLLRQPPLSPPMWVFPVVWTLLFLMMGLACCLVYSSDTASGRKRSALWVYGIQLAVNFIWPVLFFNGQLWLPAFLWLLLLWAMILGTLLQFYRIRPLAGLLLLPYLVWVTFAGYLNFGIYLLN